MRRLLHPFVLAVSAILVVGYAYIATRLTSTAPVRAALAPPFVIHWVHGPHAAGLSRRGRLWVYVSARTGTWGPPVRLGTRPELTLLRLVAANGPRRH